MKILVLNGPNLNLLGTREPGIYGSKSLSDLENELSTKFDTIEFRFVQSNHEGELIETLHQSKSDGVVFNPAAFTHTSIALLDAISAIQIPVIEVHISNIHSREEFRKNSITSGACIGQISGFGFNSYALAVHALMDHLN